MVLLARGGGEAEAEEEEEEEEEERRCLRSKSRRLGVDSGTRMQPPDRKREHLRLRLEDEETRLCGGGEGGWLD